MAEEQYWNSTYGYNNGTEAVIVHVNDFMDNDVRSDRGQNNNISLVGMLSTSVGDWLSVVRARPLPQLDIP